MPKPTYNSLSDVVMSVPEFDGEKEAENLSPAAPAAQAATSASTMPAVVVTDPKVIDFDLGGMPEEVKAEVRSLQQVMVSKLTSVIISVGNDLLRMKQLIDQHCERGTWSRFLAQGLPIKESSARHYMRAAEVAARFTNSATVAEKLSPTALYRAHNAPAEVVQEIERRVEQGKRVTGEDVDELVRAHAEPQSIAGPHPTAVDESAARSTVAAIESDGAEKPTPQIEPAAALAPGAEVSTTVSEIPDLSKAAAVELIARLREHYDDEVIIRLDELWQAAGHGAVAQHLAA